MRGIYRSGGWQRFFAKEEYCCLFVLSGAGRVGNTALSSGEGILFDCSSESRIELPAEYLKLEFSERDVLRAFGVRGIRANSSRFSFSELSELRRVAMGFFGTETEVKDAGRRAAITEWLLSYVADGASAETEDSAAASYVRYTEEYIREHLRESIQVDAIAEELGITRGYLRNVFFAVHGVSPREYLTEARLTKAEELLGEGDRSVTAVASEVGYDDVLQFSRIFKKHTGVSPSQYRKDRGIAVEKSRTETATRTEAPKKEIREEIQKEEPRQRKKDPVWLF